MTDNGIEYRAQLPIAWRDLADTLPAQISELMRENVLTLQALAALEATHSSSGVDREADRTPAMDHQSIRVEAKVDLLLHWVATLLLERHPLPPASEVILGAQQISWRCPVALATNTEGIVSLFLTPHLPAPLKLPVRISHYDQGIARATFIRMSEEAQEWLERTLFRYHRRALQARAQH